MSKRIRTFVAVELPPAVRSGLVGLAEELAEADPDVKWVEHENIHLTLKFLGDVEDPELYAVCRATQQAVAGLDAFEITVGGVGAFPDANRPRVVWAGVNAGGDEMIRVHDALEARFSALGYPREDRPYTPHITLGRSRRGPPNPDLARALERHKNWKGRPARVSEVLVFSSDLGPEGPHYTVMGRAPLKD